MSDFSFENFIIFSGKLIYCYQGQFKNVKNIVNFEETEFLIGHEMNIEELESIKNDTDYNMTKSLEIVKMSLKNSKSYFTNDNDKKDTFDVEVTTFEYSLKNNKYFLTPIKLFFSVNLEKNNENKDFYRIISDDNNKINISQKYIVESIINFVMC